MAKGENVVNWFAAVLVVAMLITVAALATVVASNEQLQKDKNASSARAEMASTLGKGQAAVQKEILKINSLITGMAQSCGQLGLNGSVVRAQMRLLMVADPFLDSIITVDRNGIVIAAEPSSIRHIEGMNLSYSENIALCLSTRLPVMGNVIQPAQGGLGVPLDVPVFDQSGMFQGAVNTLFNVSALLSSVLTPLTAGTPYTWWSMQTNGTLLYDSEGADTGHNIFGPEYAGYPQLQALAWTMVNQTAGYGQYSYTTAPSSQVVNKECFWCPIGYLGTSWRLVIAQRL
jgi:hypothetical protein